MAGSLKAWIVGARPHTLSAAVVPVLVGTALAYGKPGFAWGVFALTLIASLLVQIGANFTDEFSDHGATASVHKYLAPHKVIARGLLTERQVKIGAVAVFGAATVIGLSLVLRAGWPLLLLCLASLVVAYSYSGGPIPLGDYALGEPLVFVTMGPVMVMGTVYAQLASWESAALIFSLPVAALVTAILIANNLRDADEDRANGRRTVVTVFGRPAVRAGYAALLAVAFAIPAAAVATGRATPWLLLPLLTLPLALRVTRWIFSAQDRDTLHRALKGTSALHLSFGVLLAAGLVLAAPA
jgi:1,4-dihydroxy-2-naphthoate polyprenyltransferase